MKIDSFEIHHLRFEYPQGKGFRYSAGVCTARVTTVVKVLTDTGHVGIGSCYTHPGIAEIVIKNQMEPLLRGRDPREVEELWDAMYDITRWYGRKGGAVSALGALDVAFWDLKGKAEGKPVWKLLGGLKNTCPAYASALLWQEPAAMAQEAERHANNGFRRMKMRMGQGEERDLACAQAVREAIGGDIDFMCDAGMRLSVEGAQRIAKVLSDLNVFWFEEPFMPEDLESYSALNGTIEVPIAAGENEFGIQGFRELVRNNCVNILQPDTSRCGGISETHNVAQLAAGNKLGIATHTWSDAVAVVSNAHVVASCPTGITVEVDQTGNPFIEHLLQGGLRLKDGLLELGDEPGLGIDLNSEVLAQYRLNDPFRVPDGRYSDMVFGQEFLTPAGAYREVV